jgi:hypothetical protein
MKNKTLYILFLLIIAQFILNSCGQSRENVQDNKEVASTKDLVTLDRLVIVDSLPAHEEAITEKIIPTENIYVLLDNSYSMRGFLSDNDFGLFYTVMKSAGEIFKNSSSFYGYKMSDLLKEAAPKEDETSSGESETESDESDLNPERNGTEFFKIAIEKSNYDGTTETRYNNRKKRVKSATDEGRLPEAITLLKRKSPKNEKILFVAISDLRVTDESGKISRILSLIDPLNSFISSKSYNVGIIAIQSTYYQGLPNAPQVVNNSNEYQLVDLRNYIGEAQMKNGAAFLNCPVYIVLFGNSDMVNEYMDSFKRVLPTDDPTIKYLLLDPYPENDDGPPIAQDLYENPVEPELSANFKHYALELPKSKEALKFVFSPPLSGISETQFSSTQLAWDHYISEDKIPFWRLWNQGITDPTSDLSLSFKVGKNVTIDPAEIVIHSFEIKPDSTSTISGIDKNNLINIGKPIEDNNSIRVPLKLLQTKLNLNSPVMFIFDAPLVKKIPAAPYTEVDYTNDPNVNWYKDWTLNLEEYFKNAYTTMKNEKGVKYPWFWLDGEYYPIKENGTFYRSSGKTLELDKFIENMYKIRQVFIKTNNIPVINSDIHQYAAFGFVVRQKYRTDEWKKEGNKGNPDDPDFRDNNGNYAISDNEIANLINNNSERKD